MMMDTTARQAPPWYGDTYGILWTPADAVPASAAANATLPFMMMLV